MTFTSVIVAATLPLIGSAFKVNNSELGLVLATYVAGIGLFQILAGFGALRLGARQIYLIGLLIIGAASILSVLSTSVFELALLRFIAGSGAAFSSGTAYSLLSVYYPEGQRGKSFGLFFGITNGLGGLIGLPASAVLGLAYGWASPFEIIGTIILATVGLSFIILPVDKGASENLNQLSMIWSRGGLILRSRSIWGLSLGLAGLAVVGVAGIDYLPQYFSQSHPLWGINTAAEIAALGIGFTIPGGILGGWIGDKGIDRRIVLMVFSTILGLGIIVLPHLTLIFFWGLYAVAGIAVGITNAVMFLIPSYLKESSGEGVTLGIGVINTVQLLITSVFLSIFGFLSVTKGYTLAWTLIGVMAIVLLPLLLFVSSDGAKRSSNLQTGQVESGISPV